MGDSSTQGLVVLLGVLAVEVDARGDVIFSDNGSAGAGWVEVQLVAQGSQKLT